MYSRAGFGGCGSAVVGIDAIGGDKDGGGGGEGGSFARARVTGATGGSRAWSGG